MGKRIIITGTNTTVDGKVVEIEDHHTCYTIIKPIVPRLDGPTTDLFSYDTVNLYPTGKFLNSVEVWVPKELLDEMADYRRLQDEHRRQREEEQKPPSKVVTLESELDDLDCDDEDEDEESAFRDWWIGMREGMYDEMEARVQEQLKATLLWSGKITPGKRTFKIDPDIS